jgi:hypothetical protein
VWCGVGPAIEQGYQMRILQLCMISAVTIIVGTLLYMYSMSAIYVLLAALLHAATESRSAEKQDHSAVTGRRDPSGDPAEAPRNSAEHTHII